ncbi:MAG: RecQ family ATP-dependent DNA helicase [Spirochaetaceae bacterium]|nr:RecQ family ATP-dependent DNA helicase [Spirochaetaceae bacterium]
MAAPVRSKNSARSWDLTADPESGTCAICVLLSMERTNDPIKDTDAFEDTVAAIACQRFGIDYLFPLQRMAIANVLDAEESPDPIRQMVLFPTGFGKSICFQLPALLSSGLTIVVYPLLALMSDQQASLERRHIPSVLIRGGMSEEEWLAKTELIETKAARIVVTNPESLAVPRVQRLLSQCKVFHLAIDEAHCVSEWGETFRPAYLKLKESIDLFQPKVLSAYTATASPIVEKAIARHLFGEEPYRIVRTDIDKPNIFYAIEPTLEPHHTLLRLVNEKPKPLIVFDQSREEVRLLCELLHRRTKLDVRFYHAGLLRSEKETIEKWFMESNNGILVSTCAYGLGVDKRNIRTVIHYREPPSIEAYIQESGRGGRDGKMAQAILIHQTKSRSELQGHSGLQRYGEASSSVGSATKITATDNVPIADSEETRQTMRAQRQRAFQGYAVSQGCRRRHLLELMGQSLDSPCSGCDVCSGTAAAFPEGFQEIATFFKRNGRRFSYGDSIRLLTQAEPSSYMREPTTCAGAGLLSDWHIEDVKTLLDASVSMGILSRQSKFPWKGKLRLEV